MISKLTEGGRYNTNIIELVGLSTDVKPTTYNSLTIPNGSYFYEMDTRIMFQFDEEHLIWLQQWTES